MWQQLDLVDAMMRAMVAGHICADLRPKLTGGERIIPGAIAEVGPLDIRPGGCVANTGINLAALGARSCSLPISAMTSSAQAHSTP